MFPGTTRDREFSSNERIRRNIEMGLLYSCKKGKDRSCDTDCKKFEKCYGDESSGIFVDEADRNRVLYSGFMPPRV